MRGETAMHDASDVTQMLVCWGEGDEKTLSALLPVLYDRLKQMAHARLRGERSRMNDTNSPLLTNTIRTL